MTAIFRWGLGLIGAFCYMQAYVSLDDLRLVTLYGVVAGLCWFVALDGKTEVP